MLWLRSVRITLPLLNFFFVTNKIKELDGRYSIFGQIISGVDVLEAITFGDYILEIKISN